MPGRISEDAERDESSKAMRCFLSHVFVRTNFVSLVFCSPPMLKSLRQDLGEDGRMVYEVPPGPSCRSVSCKESELKSNGTDDVKRAKKKIRYNLLVASGEAERVQNSQSASTDLMAHSNFSRSALEKNFSMGTLNFLLKTTVRRGSM